MLKCPAASRTEVWETGLDLLEFWLVERQTAPGIITIIRSRLSTWRRSQGGDEFHIQDQGLRSALEGQDRIGWRQFLDGLLHIGWATAQQRHYERIGSRRTGKSWASLLIRKLWDLEHSLWQQRNDSVHDEEAMADRRKRSAQRQVRDEYALGSRELAQGDRYLFDRNMSEMLRQDVETMEQWVTGVRAARKYFREVVYKTSKAQRDFLRNWLNGGNPAQIQQQQQQPQQQQQQQQQQ
jgi:hypothetical protein